MRNKSVAVLDVRSDEICAAIAEKGVNNTFIIKSKYSCRYEGYSEGEFLDKSSLFAAISEAFGSVNDSVGGAVKEVWVGVPCEFVKTVQTEKVISFPSSRKINSRHVSALVDASVPDVGGDETIIDYGAVCYTLSDKRRLIDPVGMISDSLRARLSFFVCKTAFTECIEKAFETFPSVKVFHWVPQNYAQAMYLIAPEKRDGYAMLLDFGFISSTFSIVCGDGIVYSEAFSVGVGHIAVLLMEALDIPYEVALMLISQVNLNAIDKLTSFEDCNYNGTPYSFASSQLKEIIKEGLDIVCSFVETCRQSFTEKDLAGAPVYITGEGVGAIKGAMEHLASRLVSPVEQVVPKVPYYDKNIYSSLFSLLSVALDGKNS